MDLVQQHFEAHIGSIREDRKVDTAINLKAQLSAKGELIDAEESVLSVVIHGMDAAKSSSMEG